MLVPWAELPVVLVLVHVIEFVQAAQQRQQQPLWFPVCFLFRFVVFVVPLPIARLPATSFAVIAVVDVCVCPTAFCPLHSLCLCLCLSRQLLVAVVVAVVFVFLSLHLCLSRCQCFVR